MWRKNNFQEVSEGLKTVYPRLWRYCLVLTKSRDRADDLTQETCMRALNKFHLFNSGTHFDRWVFRIAHRQWLNSLRASKVRHEYSTVEIHEIELADYNLDPEANILGAEVLSAVTQLPQEQRSLVYLAYVEGYSYKECAETFDIPIGTVMSRLSAARLKLAKKFAP